MSYREIYKTVAITLILVTAGCTTPSDVSSGKEPPQNKPDIDSQLYGLTQAENKSEYASRNELKYSERSVEVVIDLKNNTTLPKESNITVVSKYDGLVQARVPVNDLVELSRHENVSYIRAPNRATETQG